MIQGLELMLFGMGTVVLFLALLVLATQLMSWSIRRLESRSIASEPSLGSEQKLPAAAASKAARTSKVADARLAAAAVAAVHRHRFLTTPGVREGEQA